MAQIPHSPLKSIGWLTIVAGLCSAGVASDKSQRQSADVILAAQKILADRCYQCHGAAKQEGQLRLDLAAEALKGGESGIVIRPGHGEESLLIEYVSGKADTVMPLKGDRLTDTEVATLKTWIDGGASWPASSVGASNIDPRLSHWSYQPVRRVSPPAVQNQAWVRNEIDAFVLTKLEREEIAPSREADRRTLTRRLSFDLLGLPPTATEVTEFLADSRPDAYERLVDRLLASPHFGERWARHWLDRARFADSSGCAIDLERPFAWRWRDWVIESINKDLPFDQFTVEQIAGDLLPQASTEDRIAVGFHRNALSNHEAGIDLEAEHVKTTIDRTTAVGTAWLGLTVGCAECHAHKYDPISQRDFYRLYSFFDNLEDHLIDAPRTADAAQVAAAQRELQALRDEYLACPANGQKEWEASVAARPQVWKPAQELEITSYRSTSSATLHQLDDGSLFVDGRLSSTDSYIIAFKSPVTTLTAVHIEALTDLDRCERGPGRGADQHALVTGISIQTGTSNLSLPTAKAEIATAEADYCQSGFTARDAIACRETSGWSLDQIGVPHAAVFVLREPVEVAAGGRIIVEIDQDSGRGSSLVRFRISVTGADNQQLAGQAIPDEIRDLVRRSVYTRTADDRAALKRYYQSISQIQSPELAAWNSAQAKFARSCATYAAQTVRDRTHPGDSFVHLRGNFRRPGDKVEPGVLVALCKYTSAARRLTRLDLAQWLIDPAHPLTARVAANDCWQHLFGVGLIATPGDFGVQGDPPSHPELLDWLASEYIRCGWSRKTLIRKIVSSSVYRQILAKRSELADRDPNNRWLARQNRIQLDAESVRDAVLAYSILLDQRVGGPGFRVGLLADQLAEEWEPQLPPQAPQDIYRRGMYAIMKRSNPDPLLLTLDAPDGASSCPLRRRTNSPIQSLALLNDSVIVAATRELATAVVHETSGDVSRRISALFARCLLREPQASELAALTDLFYDVLAEYRHHSQDAEELAQINPSGHDVAEAAAWFVVVRTVLNLDETVTRE